MTHSVMSLNNASTNSGCASGPPPVPAPHPPAPPPSAAADHRHRLTHSQPRRLTSGTASPASDKCLCHVGQADGWGAGVLKKGVGGGVTLKGRRIKRRRSVPCYERSSPKIIAVAFVSQSRHSNASLSHTLVYDDVSRFLLKIKEGAIAHCTTAVFARGAAHAIKTRSVLSSPTFLNRVLQSC